MYEQTLVGVVVPAYNEADFIGSVIDSVPEFVDRLYVVDDASTDSTWEEIIAHADDATIEALAQPEPDVGIADGGVSIATMPKDDPQFGATVVPVQHTRNRGRGGAVKTGYRLALEEGIDVVAVMDGDGQMDGQMLDRLIDPIVNDDVDYTKGTRLSSPEHRAEMSHWRLFGNGVLTVLTAIASGYYGIRDPQNGYTAVSIETLRDISIDQLYEGYGFLNDMLVRLSRHRKRVVDVPMRAIYNDEESGIQYRSFVPYLSWLLLTMYLWRLWAMVRTHADRLSPTPVR
jgi:glycosyltransferase involved in cell wall biosynthesis